MDSKYQKLPGQGKSLSSRSDEDAASEILEKYDIQYRSSTLHERLDSKWLWLAHAILLTTSLILFTLSIVNRPTTLRHVREFSAWSPADVAVQYDHVQYNITMKGNPFVGAGPEVDRAWREIAHDAGDQWISKSDLKRIGMPESHLKVDNPKTGEEGYRVGLEVFHHLHCLNLLRKVTYKEHYENLGGDVSASPKELKGHTGIAFSSSGHEVLVTDRFSDHCLEVLRLNAMCSADIGVFTLYYIEGDPLPWPALNSQHVCRNFDAVYQWASENSVGTME